MANELHKAAASPEGLVEVKRLIEHGHIDVNTPHTEEHGKKPIDFAAQSGSLATLQYLIEEAKASVVASDVEPNILSWARVNPFPEVLQYIIDPKHDLLKQFKDGTTEWHAAVIKGDGKWIQDLLSTAPHLLSATDIRGESALSLAVVLGRSSLVHLITSHPAFLSLDGADKYVPMLRAQAQNFEELAHGFSQHGDTLGKAIEMFKEAINIYLQINSDSNDYRYKLGECSLSLGQCYAKQCEACSIPTLKQRRAAQASEAFSDAVSFFEAIPDKNTAIYAHLINSHVALGYLDYNKKKYIEAYIEFERAKSFFTHLPDQEAPLKELERLCVDAIRQHDISKEAGKWGFECEDVKGDGACFFHAALCQLKKMEGFIPGLTSDHLRAYTIGHMRTYLEHYKGFMDDPRPEVYLATAAQKSTWVDNLMIQAFSRRFNVSIVIFRNDGADPTIIKQSDPKATLYFAYQVNLHYQALHPLLDAAPSQSIAESLASHPIDEWSGIALKPDEASAHPSAEKERKAESMPDATEDAPQALSNAAAPSSFFKAPPEPDMRLEPTTTSATAPK